MFGYPLRSILSCICPVLLALTCFLPSQMVSAGRTGEAISKSYDHEFVEERLSKKEVEDRRIDLGKKAWERLQDREEINVTKALNRMEWSLIYPFMYLGISLNKDSRDIVELEHFYTKVMNNKEEDSRMDKLLVVFKEALAERDEMQGRSDEELLCAAKYRILYAMYNFYEAFKRRFLQQSLEVYMYQRLYDAGLAEGKYTKKSVVDHLEYTYNKKASYSGKDETESHSWDLYHGYADYVKKNDDFLAFWTSIFPQMDLIRCAHDDLELQWRVNMAQRWVEESNEGREKNKQSKKIVRMLKKDKPLITPLDGDKITRRKADEFIKVFHQYVQEEGAVDITKHFDDDICVGCQLHAMQQAGAMVVLPIRLRWLAKRLEDMDMMLPDVLKKSEWVQNQMMDEVDFDCITLKKILDEVEDKAVQSEICILLSGWYNFFDFVEYVFTEVQNNRACVTVLKQLMNKTPPIFVGHHMANMQFIHVVDAWNKKIQKEKHENEEAISEYLKLLAIFAIGKDFFSSSEFYIPNKGVYRFCSYRRKERTKKEGNSKEIDDRCSVASSFRPDISDDEIDVELLFYASDI